MSEYPVVIQGGMGAGVSNWRLAQAVSRYGQLGVVSGTALDQILVRRLQDGDSGEHMRRALAAFPFPSVAKRVREKYYIVGGKSSEASYRIAPPLGLKNSHESIELCIVANFVEVFLAREGHRNAVGINYLEKIQAGHLPNIYGAMLAGVSYIIMGAGIPLKIPGVLARLADHQPVEYPMQVTGAQEDTDIMMRFSPSDYMERSVSWLHRPRFLAIVSSNTLASTMLKKANGKVDGLVVEMPAAGGHNAPPRGKMQLSACGEPVYGERDAVDIAKLRELGAPFWLAGGYGSPEKVQEALAQGATGVQVGTAFEFASESGLSEVYKAQLLAKSVAGNAQVFTDPHASPTGFPFKVAVLEGSGSEAEIFAARPRICDLGYLREFYRTADGSVGFRCAAEPKTLFVSKSGTAEATIGRKCLCNALMSNIGLPQVRNGNRREIPIVTAGDDLCSVHKFLKKGESKYSAADVLDELLKGQELEAAGRPQQ